MLYKKKLSPEEALQKLKHYCSYQERCHQEVKEKLYSLGVWKNEHDALISTLIEEGYLNEERFAIAFAGGRFRIKQWGRVKIRHELKQKQVGEYLIKKALRQIEESDYIRTLMDLSKKRYASLKAEQYLVRRKKTIDYLVAKGFEPNLVNAVLEKPSAD